MDDSTCVIEWERLDMMADGYTPDFVSICREFIKEMPLLLSSLDDLLKAGNLEKALRVVHQIKGSAANFGFVGVSVPMAEIEIAAKDGSLEGASAKLEMAQKSFALAVTELREKRGISL